MKSRRMRTRLPALTHSRALNTLPLGLSTPPSMSSPLMSSTHVLWSARARAQSSACIVVASGVLAGAGGADTSEAEHRTRAARSVRMPGGHARAAGVATVSVGLALGGLALLGPPFLEVPLHALALRPRACALGPRLIA